MNIKYPITAGLLVRRRFRVFLDLHNIPYTEHKGFIESDFIVTANEKQVEAILRFERAYNG